MKLISWNVNGLRAVLEKGFLSYVEASKADILCFQEIKCTPGDIQHIAWPPGYKALWNSAEKKGYSGTGVLTRIEPLSVTTGIAEAEYDKEGRVITLEFSHFFLVNVYTPNAQPELARLAYRMEWDRLFLAHLRALAKRKPVLFCGDLNVAHEEIDLARPKENIGNPGFSDQEREGFRAYLRAGFSDTFRIFDPSAGKYSWWSYRSGARAKNIGWRIDYFMASNDLRSNLTRAWIEAEITGSDHCPVGLEIKI